MNRQLCLGDVQIKNARMLQDRGYRDSCKLYRDQYESHDKYRDTSMNRADTTPLSTYVPNQCVHTVVVHI